MNESKKQSRKAKAAWRESGAVRAAEETRDDATRRIAVFSADLDEARRRIGELIGKNQALAQEMATLKDASKLREEVLVLTEENGRLRGSFEKLQAEVGHLNDEKVGLMVEGERLRKKLGLVESVVKGVPVES